MRCFGQFINDRTCDLCKTTNNTEYTKCFKTREEKIALSKKLSKIQKNCPYYTTAYDEYTPFDACNKNGNGYGRHADDCCPTLDCPGKKEVD